ncbi:DUF2309 domain-containing protein [Methylomonas sp. LL1]|uniref:DUF2309 domain-containing protein n=1 Tax=Methylomonas sp. LL1 TaxID=2785785 RepID=UPI0018C3BA80|nr:DUF2309 domain-containing protein [Methylomonas sp. LL1]QPK62220.1 DUF2309 domain-containing protein [Methylomonas sp. LL1]
MQAPSANHDSMRKSILDAIHHLDHVLPGQAPIHDFVHHNTLHGFQHLPFEQALAEFTALTGISCYLPDQQFRSFYREGRISDDDINTVLERQFALSAQPEVCSVAGKTVTRQQLYRLALLHDPQPITPSQLRWQIQELGILDTRAEDETGHALWNAILDQLELQLPELHPEDLLDLSTEQAASWLPNSATKVEQRMRQHAADQLTALFAAVGEGLSLRGLVLALTGQDVLDKVRPQLIRLCASLLDEGLAAWRLPSRRDLGLYQAWLHSADYDALPIFQELADWQSLKAGLPEDAVEAIIQQLQALAIPSDRWPGYLQRLALELPGWSGLINWRQTHPHYHADEATQPLLADYLAMRLILDRLYLRQLCKEQWRCEAGYDKLRAYFDKNKAEFAVRQALFGGQLPEYLAQSGQALAGEASANPRAWQALAERIWTWQHSPLASHPSNKLSVYNHGWRLFLICRWLELKSGEVRQLSKNQLLSWLDLIDSFNQQQRSLAWLNAYERHYQQDLLQALHANHDRGRWARRDRRPEAQIVFCMDDREEGIRRHLEELNPAIETLGAAGFFGVSMNYQGLDDSRLTPLCPVVVTPSHNVREQSQAGQETRLNRHRHGLKLKRRIADLLHHGLRRDALLAYPLINAIAPLTLAGLLAKSFFPKAQQRLMAAMAGAVAPEPATYLDFNAADPDSPATPQQPRPGFSDREQAERIAGFLRNTGLTYGFAELVVLMGHGSISQNNPHLSAYDCGACSGRHGGPNARLFAAMANRPEVRKLLAEGGIAIPEDTWFIGAEHNTCDEDIVWFDQADVPSERLPALAGFIEQMRHAQRLSAHERCRRLASAPRRPSPQQALRHFLGRAADFSQARPELGHATNASALVGRRSLTQGAFFDRRLFLISYDPTQDPDGTVLEGILLAVGPVGAGINLEYYFSTVNNERLGCGSKVPHNLTGFFAVMEGAGSDLRTGLPRQMIEIHEAMRLQLVVEAKTTVLEKIYARQESLRELISGGWVHLSAKDPDSGEIFVFERGIGFAAWRPVDIELPLRNDSPDCYRDQTQPVPPMLINQPDLIGAV